MLLELTQQCNLRCKYCGYGGTYKYSRVHNNKKMSWEIAKRSIDYFLSLINSPRRISTIDKPALTFYGGECLLEFKLLEKCVQYYLSKTKNNQAKFNLTTNGTLLNENIIRFFIKNNFSILISLDGPKSEHDKHRLYKNGKGLYDNIIQKIKLIKKIDINYFNNNVTIIAVYSQFSDIEKVIDYFNNSNNIVYNKLRRLNSVSTLETSFYEKITQAEIDTYSYKMNKLMNDYRQLLLNKNKNSQFSSLELLFGSSFLRIKNRKIINSRNIYILEDIYFSHFKNRV